MLERIGYALGWVAVVGFIGALFFTAMNAIAAVNVAQRNSGCLVLSLTPQAVGVKTGRESLEFHNAAASAGDMWCGYNVSTLSRTPGASSGRRYAPGEGETLCSFPDQNLICISSGATVCWDESYQRTATVTNTPVATATP